jgi:hypothetical protein
MTTSSFTSSSFKGVASMINPDVSTLPDNDFQKLASRVM